MKIRYMLVLAVVAMATYLVLVVGTGGSQKETMEELLTKPEVRYQAPDFKGISLQGEEMSLAQHEGKPVFLNFWASWCPPCQAEMPDLNALYKTYGEQVAFFGINTTLNDSEEAARDFAGLYQVEYPIVIDPKGEISKEYQIIAMPTSFILDAKGKIVYKKIGPVTIEEFERVVQPLLQKGNP
ncbi:TlpA family protein disulfide reductase [Brevibacillus borstelensis]|uniref:TlpA family protein disulfide reductase n=1 Tax=Brevibacillus borstelensis TaxID=45462 RepID=UPI0030BD7F1B